MTADEYVVHVLGGPSVFKARAVPTLAELRERIRQGLPYRSLKSVSQRLQLSEREAATILHIPAQTMARCRQARKLRVDESDRSIESRTWRAKPSQCLVRKTRRRPGCSDPTGR